MKKLGGPYVYLVSSGSYHGVGRKHRSDLHNEMCSFGLGVFRTGGAKLLISEKITGDLTGKAGEEEINKRRFQSSLS
jgi:hypothetical protein